MKKKLLCVVLSLFVLLSLLLGACSVPETMPSGSDSTPAEPSSTYRDMLIGTNFDPNDSSTWFVDTPSYPTEEDIDKIYPGMTLLEVFRTIGLPQRDVGSGNIVMEWDINTDMYLQIGFCIKHDETLSMTKAENWIVLSFASISRSKPEPAYNPADKSTWFSDTLSYPTAEDIAKIQSGDTLQQVFCTIGLPQRDVGSGKMILEWDLNTGGHLQIAFVKNDAYAKWPLATHMEVESIELIEAPGE